jgi:hypothetical protein
MNAHPSMYSNLLWMPLTYCTVSLPDIFLWILLMFIYNLPYAGQVLSFHPLVFIQLHTK